MFLKRGLGPVGYFWLDLVVRGPCWSEVTLTPAMHCEAGVVRMMARDWSQRSAATAMYYQWIASSSVFWWGRWAGEHGGFIRWIMVVLYDEERQTKCDTDHGRHYVEACWTQAQLLLLGLLAWAVRNFGWCSSWFCPNSSRFWRRIWEQKRRRQLGGTGVVEMPEVALVRCIPAPETMLDSFNKIESVFNWCPFNSWNLINCWVIII